MKRIVLMFCLLVSLAMTAQEEIQWMSMNEALAAQQEEPKKILMDVYTKWCGPCKLMDKRTFTNPDVIAYINENFYPVKFDAEGTEEITYDGFTYTNPNYQPDRKGRNAQHFFADAMSINSYPSLAFFDDNGKYIQAIPGYRTPQQLEIYLKMIATDEYKDITTMEKWEDYQKGFVGTFQE